MSGLWHWVTSFRPASGMSDSKSCSEAAPCAQGISALGVLLKESSKNMKNNPSRFPKNGGLSNGKIKIMKNRLQQSR